MPEDRTPWEAVATCTLIAAAVAIVAAAARGIALDADLRVRIDTFTWTAASPFIALLLLGGALALFAARSTSGTRFLFASVLGLLVTLSALVAAFELATGSTGGLGTTVLVRTGEVVPVLAVGALGAIVTWFTVRHARMPEIHFILPDEEA